MAVLPPVGLSQSRRVKLLTPIRAMKMARSAHAYVRGNTVKFYEWLDSSDRCDLPDGPPIWICGDCHVGNLGPLASNDGHVDVQIRDLDQTVIGNPAHDLVRLGLSLATAARGSDLPGATTAHMVEDMVKGYCEAMSGAVSRKIIEERQRGAVGEVLKSAIRRRWKHLAEERIKDARPIIPASGKFWALRKQEFREIDELVQSEAVQKLVTGLSSRNDNAAIRLLDAAYWIKGCSSLGRLRYAAIVRIGKRRNKPDYCFLDLKEAAPAAAPHADGIEMPKDNALRVVAGAAALSPNLGERMVAARLSGKSVIVRELLPQDLKLELENLTPKQAVNVARYLSGVVGHAHARQMNRSTRISWRKNLQRFSANLDAPPWLWNSVVELVASHEAGYLEHCRKYSIAA
jgi:uncharacterized protein (DUF2252 family)